MPPFKTEDELAAHQLEGLKWTVRHAYEGSSLLPGPAGRGRGQTRRHPRPGGPGEASPSPPATTSGTSYPFPLRAVPFEQIVRIHSSSGTTGKRKILCYTQKDVDDWAPLLRPLLRDGRGHPPGPGADRRGLRPVDRGGGLPGGRASGWGPWPCPWGRETWTCSCEFLVDLQSTVFCCTASHGAPAGRGDPQAGPRRQDQPAQDHLRLRALQRVHAPKDLRAVRGAELFDIPGSPSSTARARGSSAPTTTASITGPTTTSWRSSTRRP